MRRRERFWLKPMAVFLGVFAWLYVNIFSSNPITREYKVKVNYLNLEYAENFRIQPEAPKVTIRVKGPRAVFIQEKVEDNIFASVDLINTREGMLTLPVNVLLPSADNLELVYQEPARQVVRLVRTETKPIPVVVNSVGSVPEGFLSSPPTVSPQFLNVTAPKNVLESIKECRINLYLSDVKTSISESRHCLLIYNDGKVETDLNRALITIHDNVVKLNVAVRAGYPEKSLPLQAYFVNKMPEGKKLESVIVSPEKVTVTAPNRVLNRLDHLRVEPIDLSLLSETSTIQKKIEYPSELSTKGQEEVTLTITTTDVPLTKTIDNLPLEIHSREDHIVKSSHSTYSLEVEGLAKDIAEIDKVNIKNIISVKEKKPGKIDILLSLPKGISDKVKIKGIIPASVTVDISLKPANTAVASESLPVKSQQ